MRPKRQLLLQGSFHMRQGLQSEPPASSSHSPEGLQIRNGLATVTVVLEGARVSLMKHLKNCECLY